MESDNEKTGPDKRTIALIVGGAGLLLMIGSFITDIINSLVVKSTDVYVLLDALGSCSYCISRLGMIMFGIGLFFFVSDLFSKEEES